MACPRRVPADDLGFDDLTRMRAQRKLEDLDFGIAIVLRVPFGPLVAGLLAAERRWTGRRRNVSEVVSPTAGEAHRPDRRVLAAAGNVPLNVAPTF
jgi:hypothetical protein